MKLCFLIWFNFREAMESMEKMERKVTKEILDFKAWRAIRYFKTKQVIELDIMLRLTLYCNVSLDLKVEPQNLSQVSLNILCKNLVCIWFKCFSQGDPGEPGLPGERGEKGEKVWTFIISFCCPIYCFLYSDLP